jgi:hypothetical protein
MAIRIAIENVVAIKNEVGMPGVVGIANIFRRFRDRVIVTAPFEQNAPAWAMTFGMPFMGTSNYEYMGGEVPRYFNLLQQGRYKVRANLSRSVRLLWRHVKLENWHPTDKNLFSGCSILLQDVPNSSTIFANSSTILRFGLSIITSRQSTCLSVWAVGMMGRIAKAMAS